MSVTDVRNARMINRAVPVHDTITLGEWRQRVAAGPAPLPERVDPRPICPTCGKRYVKARCAPRHEFCSLNCRLRWRREHP